MAINKVKKYLKNLDKETTDIFGNQQRTGSGEIYKKAKGTPQEKTAANKLRNDRGQMFGALLQGRRYDESGKQIKVSSTKTVVNKKPVVKPKSKLTGADITGQKYNTKIKEEAAKIKLKVKMKEKLTPYEKSVIGSDAAIRRMNTKTVKKTSPKKK